MPPCDYKTSRAESGYAQPVTYELDSIIWERLIGQNEPMHSTSESQQCERHYNQTLNSR